MLRLLGAPNGGSFSGSVGGVDRAAGGVDRATSRVDWAAGVFRGLLAAIGSGVPAFLNWSRRFPLLQGMGAPGWPCPGP